MEQNMDLVTGATGIVGTHLLVELASRGPVRAIYRNGSDRSIVQRVFRHYRADDDELLQRIEWVEADLLDADALNDAMVGVRYVFHAAAMVSFDPRDTNTMQRVNVGGTTNVVNAALAQGVRRLCHVSSTAAIGHAPAGVPRNEDMPWEMKDTTSAYAIGKYEAELEVQRGIAEGLDAVIVNPCIILGPGLSGRSSMTLVERLRKGTRFYPPGSNAVVDARDVAECMLELADRGVSGERYLLVGENLPYRALFDQLSRAFERPIPTTALQPWVLKLGWRFERLRTLLTGSKPFITEATAHSSIIQRSYSAAKVQALLGHRFRTAEEAALNIAQFMGAQPDH